MYVIIQYTIVVLDNDSEQFVRAHSFNLISVDCDGLEVRFVIQEADTHLLAFLWV